MSVTIDPSQLAFLRERDPDWFDLARFPRMDHVSPSMTNKFSDCPEAGRQRYILGARERPAENPLIGTAVHEGVERNMRQKIESHADLTVVDVLDHYDDELFGRVLEREQEKAGEEIVWDTSMEDAKTRGRLMLGSYLTKECPKIQPIEVEGSFSVPMGMPVPMTGRYDILCADRAIDLKTGKQRTSKPKAAWLIQAAVYSFATGLPVEFHSISCSEKEHKVGIVTPLDSEALYVNFGKEEIEAIQHTIRTVMDDALYYMRRYGPDVPWPTRGRFHIFACDFCSFRPECPAWAGAA